MRPNRDRARLSLRLLTILSVVVGGLLLGSVFETCVRVKPAWGQAVGYCGYGRPCTVSKLTVTGTLITTDPM